MEEVSQLFEGQMLGMNKEIQIIKMKKGL